MSTTNRLRLILILVGSVITPFVNGVPVLASPAPQNSEQRSEKQKTVQLRIAGMTCEACAKGLEASFRKMTGVVKANVDYKAGQAVITFETAKQSPASLSKFVTECGYQVKETKVV